MVTSRPAVGRKGEEVVARWYRARGFDVLARNWRCSDGELDLVLRDASGRLLVFCEVKTRLSSACGSPLEAVTPAKVRRLRRLAGRYVSEAGAGTAGKKPTRLRVDVAAVRPGRGGVPVVEVVEDAC